MAIRRKPPTAAELRKLAGDLRADLEMFQVAGDLAPNAKATKLLLIHYAESHPRQVWKDATFAFASAAWLLVLGTNSAKDTLAIAARFRGSAPKIDPRVLEVAAGLRQAKKKAPGKSPSQELRAKLVYNILAEDCSNCLQPDTNRGMRSTLGAVLVGIRDQIKPALKLLPKRDRESPSR